MRVINEEGRLTQIIVTGKIERDPGKKWRGLVKPGHRVIKCNSNGRLSSLTNQTENPIRRQQRQYCKKTKCIKRFWTQLS